MKASKLGRQSGWKYLKKSGSKVRGHGEFLEIKDVPGGYQSTLRVTIEIEGEEKPACVVDTISRYYP